MSLHLALKLRLRKMDLILARLTTVNQQLKASTDEFISMCFSDNGPDFDTPSTPDPTPDKELCSLNRSGLRKLYYKLALLLHPDKGGSEADAELLTRAAEAYAKLDLTEMIIIARKANCPLTGLGPRDYPMLDYNIVALEESIKAKTSKSIWGWGQKTMEEKVEWAKQYRARRRA